MRTRFVYPVAACALLAGLATAQPDAPRNTPVRGDRTPAVGDRGGTPSRLPERAEARSFGDNPAAPTRLLPAQDFPVRNLTGTDRGRAVPPVGIPDLPAAPRMLAPSTGPRDLSALRSPANEKVTRLEGGPAVRSLQSGDIPRVRSVPFQLPPENRSLSSPDGPAPRYHR
jgi:hypothetical protein